VDWRVASLELSLMSLSWTTWTMIGGGGFVLLGAFILWRTADWDLKGAALDSAWTLLRGASARRRTQPSSRSG
jgi:hypothetical protein